MCPYRPVNGSCELRGHLLTAVLGRVHNDIHDCAGAGVHLARHHTSDCRRLGTGTGSHQRHDRPCGTRCGVRVNARRVHSLDQKAG